MDTRHFVWNAQMRDLWEVASELQKKEIEVDVYLHAVGSQPCSVKHMDCSLFTRTSPCGEDTCCKKRVTFSAHKLMLAAASPFLDKVLSEHYCEHRDTCVNITVPHISPDSLQYIIAFIYCGNLEIPVAVREQVLEAAKLLQVVSLIDYIQPYCSEPGVGREEQKHAEFKEKVVSRMDDEMTAPPRKRGRKRKMPNTPQEVNESSSIPNNQTQEKADVINEPKKCDTVQLGRYHRKIKSRYNSDIYEVNIPKLRKFRNEGLYNAVKKEEIKSEITCKDLNLPSKENENHHSYALNTKVCKMSDNSVADVPLDDKERLSKEIAASPPSFTCGTFDLRSMKTEDLEPQLLPLPSTLPVSPVVMPPLFPPDTSYLQESNRSQCLTEISCASFIEPQACKTRITKEPIESSSLNVTTPPPSSSSLLTHTKDPPVTSPPPFQRLPLKQVSAVSLSENTSDTFQEKKDEEEEEEEEEDGLLKWQVLLKECEDFPEGVSNTTHDSVEDGESVTVKYQDRGVNIDQWISEEIHCYVTPKPDDSDEFYKESEQSADNSSKVKSDGCTSRECSSSANCTLENDKASYECEICGKMFLDLRSCQSHIRGVHHEARQMCKFCGKMFKRRCDLYQHERRHNTANLPCKFCGKIFKLSKDLAAHMTTHTGGKRFHCSHCNKVLTSSRNLRNHIASIHQKQRAFVCQICNKTYSKSCSLQVHIRSVHTGERPFKCTVCNKSFCDSALLRLHSAVHTGERKYSCKVCERRFNQYSNMISHQRVHTNHRPFMCVICKENFKTREGLLKHKWIHTGLKPLRCRHCSKEFRIKESYERHMLKCHNEVISLPGIYFEMSEDAISEEPNKTSSGSSIRLFKSIGDSDIQEAPTVCVSSNSNEKMAEKKTANKNSPQDMGLVVHFIRDVTQVESSPVHLTSDNSGQMQLNYALLSSDANSEENEILSSNATIEENDNVTLENLANQISSSEKVAQSIDVESLLQENVEGPGSSTIVLTKDSKTDIHETAIGDCKHVVILKEASETCVDELSSDIHSSSTIKIWMPSEKSIDGVDDDCDDRASILRVSDQTFSDSAQTLPVLGSGFVSKEVVQTVVINGPQSDILQK